MVEQHRLERGKPLDDPVPHPPVAFRLRHVPFALEVLQHAQVVERMDVAGDQLRQRAHALAIARRGRQQRGLLPDFVQVFEDRQRLPQHALAMLQHRHQSLRVGFAEFGAVLFAAIAQQVHRRRVRRPSPFRFRPIRTR